MTRKEIEALKSGRELDMLVATHVLGWKDIEPYKGECYLSDGVMGLPPDSNGVRHYLPTFSQYTGAAVDHLLTVVQRTCGVIIRSIESLVNHEHLWKVEIFDGEPMICNGRGEVSGYQQWSNTSPTIAEAACKASLLAYLKLETDQEDIINDMKKWSLKLDTDQEDIIKKWSKNKKE